MVRGHFAAALSVVWLFINGIHGDSINEYELNGKIDKIQVELTGMREQMHWQEEIHKLKLERMEVRFALIENKQSETIGRGSTHECSLALADIQQLSAVLEYQTEGREDECKRIQDHATEQISRLVAAKITSSVNSTDRFPDNTTMGILTNSLSEMQTTLEELKEKVEDLVSPGLDVDLELVPSDNTTTVNDLDQCRTMVESLQVKVDELNANIQQPKQSGRDSETYTYKIKPHDCHDIYLQGERQDGVYKIYPEWNNTQSVRVWCEFDVGSEVGWTIILARMPTINPVNFSRGWDDYKAGFGDAQYEYWIGLLMLHQIFFKRHCSYVLQVNLHSWDLTTRHAQYKLFSFLYEFVGFHLYKTLYSPEAQSLGCYSEYGFAAKAKRWDKN
ncbi:unnamed protein product, partial [Meganyctiphanes norvegica]